MELEPIQHRLAAILCADVAGYSRLMAEDEAATLRTLTVYHREIGARVRQRSGFVVDTPGDHVLAQFSSALDAVRAALEIQSALAERNEGLPENRRMYFRVGIHLGDVAVEGERIYGNGVDLAARLERMAEPGGLCISGSVHEQLRHRLALACEDLGEQTVGNLPDPVRVYRVRLG